MQHVVVLCGGRSAEHEISLISAASVIRNLNPDRYRISVAGIRKDGSTYPAHELADLLSLEKAHNVDHLPGHNWLAALAALYPPPDIVFPVLHGPFGEDGTIQGALEVLDLPYVGSGVSGSAVGMNKIHTKMILARAGLPVLPWVWMDRHCWERQREEMIAVAESTAAYPLFVKPANMGSSIGVNKSKNRSDLARHIDEAFRYDDFTVIEKGIEAREIEVSVLGNLEPEASVAGEIIPSREFYTYESKYIDESSRLLIPAPLARDEMERVRSLAIATYRSLQLEGMARVDFLMDKKTGDLWINEPNT
ncbi:MAG TPA: D-alanine--D-alanine ligase family protein, partial [Acidobacteriota bacterium]|nr:D-alanine--D-alanine ligase family protein [Acidobacteriota bacterium]